MKKIISIILSIVMISSIFCNVLVAEDGEIEIIDEVSMVEEDLENITRNDYDDNVDLAKNLGIDLDSFLSDIEDSLSSSDILAIDLPNEITVNIFDPLVLFFNTKKGIVITNVNWYLEGQVFSDPHMIEGKLGHSNLLVIPSFAFRYSDILHVEAEYTYYDLVNKKSGKGFTGTTDIYVDTSIMDDKNQILNLGDFSIRPGQTLYLDLLGIGKGKVSLSKDGNDITLDNVDFSYDPNELYIDRILTMNRGLAYYSYTNNFKDININLIGENKIANLFRSNNIDEDGGTFSVVCSGDGMNFEFNPNINIKGPGSLKIYGGQYCIEGFGHVVVDTKLELVSSKYIVKGYDTPARIGNGIYCVAATLTGNADVDMDIAGKGISASLLTDDSYGNIDIEEGAKLNIVNTSYIRHPWEAMFLPSKTYGLSYTNALNINGAIVDMKFIADADLYKQYEEDYGETSGNAYIAVGIASEGKSYTASSTIINDSVVNISAKAINVKEDDDFALVRAYGIDTHDTLTNKEGVEHSKLSINNSKVNIDLGDIENTYSSVGIYASNVYFKESDISITSKGIDEAVGIRLNDKTDIDNIEPFVFDVVDSDVKIDSISIENVGKSYGVIGGDARFTYNDETKSFVANALDGTVVCFVGSGEIERFNEKNYKPTKISLIDNTRIVDNLPINIFSRKSSINQLGINNLESKDQEVVNENDNVFISNIYSFEERNDSEEKLSASNSYKYYETIYLGDNVAPSVTIRKIQVKPTPVRPYVAPKTGVD